MSHQRPLTTGCLGRAGTNAFLMRTRTLSVLAAAELPQSTAEVLWLGWQVARDELPPFEPHWQQPADATPAGRRWLRYMRLREELATTLRWLQLRGLVIGARFGREPIWWLTNAGETALRADRAEFVTDVRRDLDLLFAASA